MPETRAFHGQWDLVIDEKNRISIPARIREQMLSDGFGNGLVLALGVHKILSLYPEECYERVALAVAPRTVAADRYLAHERLSYADAVRVELDRQGRVLLPEPMLIEARIRERAVLTGARDRLELWPLESWHQYRQSNLSIHEEMMLKAHEEMWRRAREEAGW